MRWFPDLNEFISDYDELHVFVIGIGAGFFFWREQKLNQTTWDEVQDERHYYDLGSIFGGFLFLGAMLGFIAGVVSIVMWIV